jgi:hypothetical protein
MNTTHGVNVNMNGGGGSSNGITSSSYGNTSRLVASLPVRNVTCNRCLKAVTTTVFVCACDCLFCEGRY